MASLINMKNGARVIQVVGTDGLRKYIRLGKVNKKQAETIKLHIEDLAACKWSGSSPKNATLEWVADIHDAMRRRLERAQLVKPRSRVVLPSLKSWIRAYIDRRTADVKPNTLLNFEAAYRSAASSSRTRPWTQSRRRTLRSSGRSSKKRAWGKQPSGGAARGFASSSKRRSSRS